MKPFFSIIMAVYNNEKYFPTAVNSIINQSYSDFELIIVDDGSTDDTSKIADDFAKKDSRIKVIHQENQWIYASFNNGIATSQGEYIMIVNSDDTINPDSLKEIKKEVDANEPDMIIYNTEIYYCDEEQNIINSHNRGDKIKENFHLNTKEQIAENWPYFMKTGIFLSQNIYKSEIAKANLFRNDVYMADGFYNLKIANQLNSISGIKYLVYNHFRYNTTINTSYGKYYAYEHATFNEYCAEYKKLFKNWNLNCDSTNFINRLRLIYLSSEFRNLNSSNCPLSYEEKVEKIFWGSVDEFVYTSALEAELTEELEARIFSALREIFLIYIPPKNTDAHIIYDMLESLLRYEKDENDIEKIKKCVYYKKNKYNIGEIFFKKLKL